MSLTGWLYNNTIYECKSFLTAANMEDSGIHPQSVFLERHPRLIQQLRGDGNGVLQPRWECLQSLPVAAVYIWGLMREMVAMCFCWNIEVSHCTNIHIGESCSTMSSDGFPCFPQQLKYSML